RTGNLLASRTIENASMGYDWTLCAGNGEIVTYETEYPNSSIVMLDPATLEEVSRIENESVDVYQLRGSNLDASCANGGIWSNGDIIAFGPNNEGTSIVFDVQTGEQVETELGAYTFEGATILFHDSGNGSFCIGAGPSELACFDLPDGTLRWTREVPQGTPTDFTVSPDGNVIIMQASGSLVALDATSGSILGTSTNPVGTLHGCSFSADSSTVYAQCQMPDDSFSRCTLHVIRLDDPTLTPISSIDYGVTLSSDEGEVLIDTSSSSSSTWVLPYLSLDELIAQGNELTTGFELTDQERRALMIE
ncbi:MAG: PQQ-binding-like beta-propeller repeat protein, partial [Eggerthellaceae bacterium]|nr:PQQ-binding-like beta-propeller repeat protein [Eggerthellaceae bacterium]